MSIGGIMDKELNIINVAIKDNKYYFLNLENKTIIEQFDISDFLIEFSGLQRKGQKCRNRI